MILFKLISITVISILAGFADAARSMGAKNTAVNMRIARDIAIAVLFGFLLHFKIDTAGYKLFLFWLICYRIALHGVGYAIYRTDLSWWYLGTSKNYDRFLGKILTTKWLYGIWIAFWLVLPLVVNLVV